MPDDNRSEGERNVAASVTGFQDSSPRARVWMRVTEAAEYSGLSSDTIYTACERGELRHVRVGGRRTIRIRAEWIDAWLERHAQGAA